jgi:hypothetical protein
MMKGIIKKATDADVVKQWADYWEHVHKTKDIEFVEKKEAQGYSKH